MKRANLRPISLVLTLVVLLSAFVVSVGATPTARLPSSTPNESVLKASPTPGPEEPPPPLLPLEPDISCGQTTDISPPRPGPELHLAVHDFDPLLETPSDFLHHRLILHTPPSGNDYFIIQFKDRIHESDKESVTVLGVELFDYIPDFGFLARMDAATAQAVEKLDLVRWVGLYQPGFRLEPALVTNYIETKRSTPVELLVVTFKGEDIASIAKQLESMGGTVLETTETHWKGKTRVEIDSAKLADIADLPGVKWIEMAPVSELSNSEAADIMKVRPVWDIHGLYGAGQIVGICDTGLDQGSTGPANLHDDFEDGSGTSRVIALYDLVGGGDGAEDNDGHGTHVAGSVLGNGDLSGATPSTHSFPSTCYAGMSPDAQLVFQAVEDDGGSLSGIPSDLNTLFSQAYNAGARLHSNSWSNVTTLGLYNSNSRDVDEFTWDHPYFLPFFSASNEGTDADSDGVVDLVSTRPPGTAKNCVTVGATENDRPGMTSTYGGSWLSDFPTDPINSDRIADDSDGMVAFSGRGFTLDERIKPDIVAPGTFIASTRSALGGTGWGVIDDNYIYMGGTSMSTPLATGAATLAREFFVTTETYTPTAALLKATLVNGATSIYPGQYGTGATQEITLTRPSPQEGWGRLNLEASLFPVSPRRTWYWDSSAVMTSSLNLLSTGETVTYTFQVTQSSPLSITLAWTDYPGSPLVNGRLVNDLDLSITDPNATVHYPNHANPGAVGQTLYYDDGDSSTYYTWSSGDRVGVRFTPNAYPVTLQKGQFMLIAASYPKTFDYYVYDGDTSGPDSILASGSTALQQAGWHEVDLSGSGVTINSGDFFLVIELPDSNLGWFYDYTAPIDNRSWDYDGSWSLWTVNDYMFRAVVSDSSTPTDFDRVNNVVGIDIDTPVLGTYTATVSGYNVPFGPQSYALVLSGVGRLLGTETITRTIPATGTYKFGNTGVAIEFTDESLDSVAVTVYRDQYPNAASTNVMKRRYSITPVGGSGTFTANVTFSYEQAEFEAATGSFAEDEIVLYSRNGSTWISHTVSSRDTANNTITIDDVTSFSNWALGGPDDQPTAVTLARFEVTPDGSAIRVEWETAIEIDTLGFNLYRAESLHGPQVQLNEDLIPAQMPGSPAGAAYTYLDETVASGTTYYYWLETMDVHGGATRHGPVSAAALASLPHRIYLPLVIRQ